MKMPASVSRPSVPARTFTEGLSGGADVWGAGAAAGTAPGGFAGATLGLAGGDDSPRAAGAGTLAAQPWSMSMAPRIAAHRPPAIDRPRRIRVVSLGLGNAVAWAAGPRRR